uniref:Uncharacterized protein n=1 Tax=Rhizophora mucronata TaxID=61149 RepID=A0A2P2J1J1_RHIMU
MDLIEPSNHISEICCRLSSRIPQAANTVAALCVNLSLSILVEQKIATKPKELYSVLSDQAALLPIHSLKQ